MASPKSLIDEARKLISKGVTANFKIRRYEDRRRKISSKLNKIDERIKALPEEDRKLFEERIEKIRTLRITQNL